MDFVNWNIERQKLKDEIFKELREQKDRKSLSVVRGSITINPQFLEGVGATHVYGPYFFETRFQTIPVLTFGQQKTDPAASFIVQPQVNKWSSKQGSVEGFYLEVYALIAPPEGLTKHIITWRAEGKASLYRAESKSESWKLGYTQDKADHLYGTQY